MDIALFLLLSWLLCSSSMTRSWLPLFTGFPCALLWRAGLGGSEEAPLGDSRPWPLLALGQGTWAGLGVSGGLGWAVKAADCWDCCMWTGELWTWWMTTGEEGITPGLMVEFWSSGGAAVEVGWASVSNAAAAGLLSTGILAEGSAPLWEPSVACLQREGKHYGLQAAQRTLVLYMVSQKSWSQRVREKSLEPVWYLWHIKMEMRYCSVH